MYSVSVGQSKKARLNLTIDPDIYRASRRAFDVLDMNMSGFVEQQLALFLQLLAPFEPVMDQIREGEVDPAILKTSIRAFNTSTTGLLGEQLVQFGKATQDLNTLDGELEVNTDKK